MKPTTKSFINYNPRVGPDSMVIIGYPGTGKSVHANKIAIECIRDKNEIGLTHGDVMCEWRHLLNYGIEIKLIIPKGLDYTFLINNDVRKLKRKYLTIYEVEYPPKKIADYLEPGTVTAIYDDCFDSPTKTRLWIDIMRQVIFRPSHVNSVISYINHEAGVAYPQTATKDQWKFVDLFSEIFVYFRKCYVRAILLCQIETEIYSRIREKCMWRIYRISLPGKHSIGRPVRKYAPRMRRDQYHIFYGSLFTPMNSNPKINEIKSIWKILPRALIELDLDSHNGEEVGKKVPQLQKSFVKLIDYALARDGNIAKLSRETGIGENTIRRHRTDVLS